MKAVRLTPVNIACAILLAWAIWSALSAPLSWASLIGQLGLLTCLVIADQFFRFFLRQLKRIWIAELIFLALTALIVWIWI